MFSEAMNRYAQRVWDEVDGWLQKTDPLTHQQVMCSKGTEQIFLKLLYGTLPVSDVIGVPFETLQSYVHHGLFLLENVPELRQLPEDLFVHYVLYPRINSEEIVDCRPFFWEMLNSVVRGLTGEEAVLAVNRWCAAQMTYASTDDRTIDPKAAYFCGSGRCGEESTFAVTALRSVGIPARQVYATWWSHCDDNHAWVEVFVDGRWRFLGACEPEPELDRGWFKRAASRAMLICSRRFCDFTGTGTQDEQLCRMEGSCSLYNQTSRYCRTTLLNVKVLDAYDQPIRDIEVRFYVLNMGRMSLIASLRTDVNGQVFFETGLGSLYVETSRQKGFAWEIVHTGKVNVCTLRLEKGAPEEGTFDWDMMAPDASCGEIRSLTAEESRQKARVLEIAKTDRMTRLNGYMQYATGDPVVDEALKSAGKNSETLWSFYQAHPEGRELLLSLSPKDWRDVRMPVLEAFVTDQKPFVSDVHCPRIGFEPLADWKSAVGTCLSEEQKAAFTRDPERAWKWIQENFLEGTCRWVKGLWIRPDVALRVGAADERGRGVLFVAVMRTLGIPARLSNMSDQPQYWDGQRFRTAGRAYEDTGCLTLEDSGVLRDRWSLEYWEGERWAAATPTEDGSAQYPVGIYRLITTNRLPNGDQLARCRIIKLDAGGAKLRMEVRPGSPEQMLASYPVELQEKPGRIELRIWLEQGTEPTEHILNELASSADLLRACGLPLVLLVPEGEDFVDPRAAAVGARVVPVKFDGEQLENLARSLYQEPGQMPITCLTDGVTAFYGQCGYAVGTIPLVLSLVQFLNV